MGVTVAALTTGCFPTPGISASQISPLKVTNCCLLCIAAEIVASLAIRSCSSGMPGGVSGKSPLLPLQSGGSAILSARAMMAPRLGAIPQVTASSIAWTISLSSQAVTG